MWRAVALFCFAALSAGGQKINATSGPWSAALGAPWHWHSGDNTQWAPAAFDDSGWPVLQMPAPAPPDRRYWMRLHVQLGATSDPGLLLGPIAYAYDVYWDGQRIGSFGDLPRGKWFTPRWQTFPLPRDLGNPGDHVIAIRAGQIGYGFARPPRLLPAENRVGDIAALQDAESAQIRGEFQPRLPRLLVNFGLLLGGIYFFLLPPAVSQGAAFRWLGVILIGRALIVFCQFQATYGALALPGVTTEALIWALALPACIGMVEFPYALFRRPVPRSVRGVECMLVLLLTPLPLPLAGVAGAVLAHLISVAVPLVVVWAEFRRGTSDAGLTLAAFATLFAATLQVVIAAILDTSSLQFRIPMDFSIAGYQFWTWDLASLFCVPAIAMQAHKTNLRFHDDQQRLRGEMEAARHVQKLLLPSQSIKVPGFEIDARYHPATEVGGDFFQLFPVANDGLLVVVGDVSGKGVKAALLVSVIVGALQNRRSDVPALLLCELNSVLLARSDGGFTTCCCALFSADGSLTIANAGHIAPYRNGKEIETAAALPLGIDTGAVWTEQRLDLESGDRILWVSDGVVEARNSKRDLLGFESTQELAARSASEIVRAAQRFGQEDDITVISVTRQPAGAALQPR